MIYGKSSGGLEHFSRTRPFEPPDGLTLSSIQTLKIMGSGCEVEYASIKMKVTVGLNEKNSELI